jgi:hypothetical protein
MRAHSQTIDHGSQVSIKVPTEGLDWFQRLRQWLRSFTNPSPQQESITLYGTWDAKREQFHQLKADSAADLVAAQHGISWSSKIYGGSL